MWEDRRCGENLVENRCGFLLRHAENALKEHQEETAHIDLRQNVAVRCFLIKIHGIHNRLSDAEASGSTCVYASKPLQSDGSTR